MLPHILLAGLGLAAAAPHARRTRPVIGLANVTRIDLADGLSARALSSPQMGVDFPDPSLIFGDGSWKAYGTTSNKMNVPIATSDDAFTWTFANVDAMPTLAPWDGGGGIWAPDVNKNDDGTYVMYFTGRHVNGKRCIGVATSDAAMGPFAPLDSTLICDDVSGVIDPSGYDDGTDRWIVWKVDGNSRGGATTCQSGTPSGDYYPTPIMIQRMERDGIHLTADAPTQILDNEGASNDGITEAPALYRAPNGEFVLFYSAHCYSSDDYDIEYAWSSTINGTYGNRGILARTVDNIGIFAPGGLDIDPNGVNGVFHGRTQANDGGGIRQLYSATLTFDGESVSH